MPLSLNEKKRQLKIPKYNVCYNEKKLQTGYKCNIVTQKINTAPKIQAMKVKQIIQRL